MAWKRHSLTLHSLNDCAQQQSTPTQQHEALCHARLTAQYETESLDTLTSLHKRVAQATQWSQLLELSTPPQPAPENKHTRKASRKQERYHPSCFDRWFHLVEKKQARLQQRLAKAKQRDQNDYQLKLRTWQLACQPIWQRKALAKKILEGNVTAKINVLHAALATSPYADYCTNWSLTTNQQGDNQLAVQIKGLAIIPKKRCRSTTEGLPQTRSMSKKERYHLYRQHVVSLALGLANEYFAQLPDHRFYLIAFEEQRMGVSGQRRLLEVLSFSLTRQQLASLPFETMDLATVLAVLGGKLISQTKLFTIK